MNLEQAKMHLQNIILAIFGIGTGNSENKSKTNIEPLHRVKEIFAQEEHFALRTLNGFVAQTENRLRYIFAPYRTLIVTESLTNALDKNDLSAKFVEKHVFDQIIYSQCLFTGDSNGNGTYHIRQALYLLIFKEW